MFLSVCVFPGNQTHNLLRCWRNALPLSHTETRFPRCPWPWAESRDPGNNWLELLCVCMCVSVFVCPHLTRRLCFSMPSCLGLSANLIWHWRPTAHRSGVLCVCVCVCVCLTALIFVGVCGIILVCECLKADGCLCWQGVINRDGCVKQRMLHTWQD